MIAALVLPLAGSTFAGCLAAGPCIIEYRDAVVHLGAVRDSATGAFLDSVFITKVTVNGESQSLVWVAEGTGHEAGVLLDADTLRCRLGCSFGHEAGRWNVTLLARGYPLQTVAFDARYAKVDGGCPGYVDRGTLLALRLARAPVP